VDNKVKIKGKPYIHGFDIDIFIPELNIGIEFDGGYYHTFAGLKELGLIGQIMLFAIIMKLKTLGF
jgi:hypothetical protein